MTESFSLQQPAKLRGSEGGRNGGPQVAAALLGIKGGPLGDSFPLGPLPLQSPGGPLNASYCLFVDFLGLFLN